MFTVGLYTLGCKVAQYETEAIGEEFERRGVTVLPFDSVCDAYVINTCTVTAESDRKSRQMIRRAITRNPSAAVAVVGCYSQRDPDSVLSIDGVDIVLGTDGKLAVVDEVIARLESGTPRKFSSISDLSLSEFEPMCIEHAPRTRAYVKIEDGCECKCTYCAISGARGRVRSKPMDDVIREVEGLYRAGTREVVLTGIETGSWGVDLPGSPRLADLICELNIRHSCERIRLGSLAPELVGEDFIMRVKDAEILAPHFHISIQSGSDRILAAMKRRYNSARAIENIKRLREYIPSAQFTTDLMVGFPGETDEDFYMTAELVHRVGFLDSHVFAYSRREGTPAADYPDQVPEIVKRKRSTELIGVCKAARDKVLDKIVHDGDVHSVIIEDSRSGVYTAHSASFVEFVLECEEGRQGDMVRVVPVLHKDGVVLGRIVD